MERVPVPHHPVPPEGADRSPSLPGVAGCPEDPSFEAFIAAWNEIQGLSTPLIHRRIAEWLEASWRGGDRRLLLMVFRDAGKSTLVGLFSAWLLTLDPNLRVLVLSADQALATKMTRNVRRVIERHPWTTHLKPRRSELWAADQLTVDRSMSLRDPSLMARGITGNITGSRADIVICDDVEVPNTCDTAQKRQDLRCRLTEIAFILVPGGTQLYVGTPHSYYSIYADQARAEAGEETPYLAGFSRLVLPITDPQGRSLWPERFDDAYIERLRREAGPIRFRSQMMLLPAHAREVRLDPERLGRYDGDLELRHVLGRPQLSIDGRRMVGAACWWDPAYGRPKLGDASVIAVVFVDESGDYWLHGLRYLEVDSARAAIEDEATQQCQAIADFIRLHHQHAVNVEINGLGRFLPSLLRNTLRRAGVPATVVERTSRTSKEQRILSAFDPLLAARRLHAHSSIWASPFVEEMREWTPGGRARDDALDAVSGCIAAQPVRPSARLAPPGARPLWRPSDRIFTAITDFRL